MLISGRLSPQDGLSYSARLRQDDPKDAATLFPPVMPSGRVSEIVPPDQVGSLDPRLSSRSLGWIELGWHRAWRAFWTWRALGASQRRECGLTWRRMLSDLAGAYRIASRFRGVSYVEWVDAVDCLDESNRGSIKRQVSTWHAQPHFQMAELGVHDDPQRTRTLASLDRQLYRNFSLGGDVGGADNSWLMLLGPGDQLSEHALYWFASEARSNPDAVMIYADDDEIEAGRRCRPRFKPDWSMTHLRATDYIGRAVALNARAVAEAGGLRSGNLAGDTWELLLRVGERAGDRVCHIPAVLLHRDAEQEKLARPVCRRIRFELPAIPPWVSIVIPTRDAMGLLRQCVESLLEKTTYPRFEIVVVDNGSRDPAALDYLAEIAARPGIRVLRYDRPFNYSAINNFAVREACGDVVCLLNNDTEVISPDWLEEMVGHLTQDKVGVVGAKLYYPDGRVQHAGDTVGPGGCANHLHQHIAGDDPGYCNRAIVAQELSAVTAACLLTWRKLYLELGGLNEKNLPIAFNDVDYCLRVRKAGYKVIWTPHAELYHHESVSRGRDKSLWRKIQGEREARYMRRTWRKEMESDPFYNPNFSYFRPDFVLGPAPRVSRPWLEE